MSTSTLAFPEATSQLDTSPARNSRLTFPRIVRSEWIKFRTLRSTIWTLAVTLVLMVGIVALVSAIGASQSSGMNGTDDGGGSIAVFSIAVSLAQLPVVVLGVLVITGEYSTGMIRSTLAAVPRRLPTLWAKGVVLAVSVFVLSAVAVAISLIVMQVVLGGKGLAPDLGDAQTVRVLVGTPLYLAAIAVFSLAIGALLRYSAGALAAAMGLLLVIPVTFVMIPWKPLRAISPFLPEAAGSRILTPQAQIDLLSQGATNTVLGPWQGFAVLLVWVAVLLTVAGMLLRRRDA